MNSPVFAALFPVVLLAAIGFIAGRAGWIRAGAIKDLSSLVFLLLTPALLFAGTLVVQGFNRRAAVLALLSLPLVFMLLPYLR